MSSTAVQTIVVGDAPVSWRDVVAVARDNALMQLSEQAWGRITQARQVVEHIVARRERAYGINTGLGALCNVVLEPDQLSALSRNTLLSHACGVGRPLKSEQVRAILCAAIINYSHGHSGISRAVVEALLAMLNQQITPVVPAQGSVGYLTHMAHISLTLIGVGQVEYAGRLMPAAEAWQRAELPIVELGAKEGLSLVNGTPCMTGLSCLALADIHTQMHWADITGAMSFEALRGQLAAFDPEVLALKPYAGVVKVGEHLRALLQGSEVLQASQGIRTQDALSIRSMPQIHGACREQVRHAAGQVDVELNSATDNPLIIGTADNYRVVSQANPHGEPVAMAADVLALAVAELGGVAERRIDRLINPLVSGLPPFLVAESGVNSGMMIVQYVAASLVADNRRLAQPAVTDNYITSALQEDHLSMGTSAALKLAEAVDNLYQILAIEYLLAAQAFEFLPEAKGVGTQQAWQQLRQHVEPYHQDRWLAPEIDRASQLLRRPDVLAAIEKVL
ncbi:histidine ammonia-lyase [Pokkaliibacter plantistimulans]|uniref:Histidine ammonia-lyase n=1 Tax=Pokkaliibacter plantistimulans TaxID=1635171 RepID=A0ABX5LRS5_9GAMM|nr:histidine ammonia-lyase [Pokkaliibacter plantistimulans]PXF29344.1 histidine ammonia-lyase [Pokkaliibacter plantistimulans]